ncbi:MAG: hypothetical protein HC915_10540 [Anaerolineae bacterium]|nr:hypothetical protein [Anaerolineae bacterium]
MLTLAGPATWEGVIQVYPSVWEGHPPYRPFAAAVAAADQSYQAWLAQSLPVPAAWAEARQLAAYINWSCVVAPRGHHQRPAMLMSKNWMNKVWSWDHCFNALALARQDPALAWDQFVLFFDHQEPSGAIPDHLTDSTRSFRFYKPPIHGWALRELLKRTDAITPHQLAAVYAPLARWTEWWFRYRDDDGDGVPQYNHGNESGWDNGTVFSEGVPVESPDLSAYLVIQMDALAELATRLGKPAEAAHWRERADRLLALLMAHFWNGDQFVAQRSGSPIVPAGDSALVLCLCCWATGSKKQSRAR